MLLWWLRVQHEDHSDRTARRVGILSVLRCLRGKEEEEEEVEREEPQAQRDAGLLVGRASREVARLAPTRRSHFLAPPWLRL